MKPKLIDWALLFAVCGVCICAGVIALAIMLAPIFPSVCEHVPVRLLGWDRCKVIAIEQAILKQNEGK